MQVGKADAGLQAWTILAAQLPWQSLALVPVEDVQQSVLPSLRMLCDEISISASQGSQAAHAAALQLAQVGRKALLPATRACQFTCSRL